MTTNIGLWIDHRQAKIVSISESGEELKRIESNVEKQVHSSGESTSSAPYGSHDVVAGDIQDRRYAQHLNVYYDEVIECLRGADSILVLGPGEAKGEFHKRIKSKELRQRIAGVETADKLTDNQLAAKVRDYFQAQAVG